MSTAIAFPYNQTVQAFTPTVGTYQGVTFVICCTSNGLGGGQLQPVGSTSATSTTNYQSPIPFPEGIDADGASNSAMCFLFNAQNGWINQAPPYYFVVGSTAKNLWLYSLTPAESGDNFTSSNIKQISTGSSGKIEDFDTEVACVYFYSSLNLLFVGGDNGNLYTFQVSWDSSGVPSFSYQGANENYTSPTGCAVSMTFFYNSTLIPTAQIPNPATASSSNQYIPAGSYQSNSTLVSVKITAQCTDTAGNQLSSTLTYTDADVATIGDISNNNGVLTIVSGSSSTSNLNARYGPYVPAGSYQNSCSEIWIEITATCNTPSGSTATSTLSYPAEAYSTIVDISNNNGSLILITPVFLVVTGLTQGDMNGSFYFPISLANNGVLPDALGMLSHTQNSVATVVSQENQTIYTATQSAIVANAFIDLGGSTGATLWDASSNNELILSMVGVPNPQGYTYQGNFSKGALVVGTVSSSSTATNTTPGNLYAIDPNASPAYVYTMASSSNTSDPLTGAPYSLFADCNYHLFVNFGSTGLLLYDLPSDSSATTTSGSSASSDPVNLIPNVTSSTKEGWWKWVLLGVLLAAAIIVVSVATAGTGDAVVADVVADEAEADAAESSVDAAADDGGDGAEGGGEGADGDGGGEGNSGSDDASLTSQQNQGGTCAVIKGNQIYPFYINGALLQIPADTPADVVTAILKEYNVLFQLG